MRPRTATPTAPLPRAARPPQGLGLVGLVIILAVLGGMAAVAVLMSSSGRHHDAVGVSPTQKLSAAPGAADPDISAAAVATCRADYHAVVAAATDFQAIHGMQPATMTALQSMFKDPVTSTRFAITIDPRHPGQAEVAAGGHAAAPGDGNCTYAA
jgi:hypothetical protein